MQHYRDVVQDRSGNVIGGAIVTVIDHSSGQSASLYSDANGSIPLTSVITDTNGTFSFYVASGRYDITVSKNGIVLSSVSDVFITVTADYPTAMSQADATAGISTLPQTISASVLQTQKPTAMDSATAQAGTSTTAQTVSASVLDGAVQYGTFTPTGTGAVSRTVQSKLQDVVSVFDFMTAAQIADVKAGTLLIDVTTPINNAIATNNPVFFPSGKYLHTGVTIINNQNFNNTILIGNGKFKTELVCLTAGKDNIKITSPLSSTNVNDFSSYVTIKSMSLTGAYDATTGCGILLDTVSWYTIEDLYIAGMGSHGIEIKCSTGLPINGSFIGSITKTKCQVNRGDGFRQIAKSSSGQQNATWIAYCEMQQNYGNGITLWGLNLTVQNNAIEGNAGYGVQLDNKNITGSIYSSSCYNISQNYFESNSLGHINIRCSSAGSSGSGVISGIVIENNYGYSALTTPVPFTITAVGSSSENAVRGLRYDTNSFANGTAAYPVVADFNNSLDAISIVNPDYRYNSSSSAISAMSIVETQYINIGYGRLSSLKNYTPNGYLTAKGGANISYSTDLMQSNNITISPANCYFPISLPMGSQIDRLGIAVSTDSTAYSVQLKVLGADYTFIGVSPTFVIFQTIVSTKSGSQYLLSEGSLSHGAYPYGRVQSTNLNLVLYVNVIITTPGTFFKIGNPTVFYV